MDQLRICSPTFSHHTTSASSCRKEVSILSMRLHWKSLWSEVVENASVQTKRPLEKTSKN